MMNERSTIPTSTLRHIAREIAPNRRTQTLVQIANPLEYVNKIRFPTAEEVITGSTNTRGVNQYYQSCYIHFTDVYFRKLWIRLINNNFKYNKKITT